jgi:hypothetical protein
MTSPPQPITKRPGSLTTYARRTFDARYAGSCASCSAPILPGDNVFYAPGNEAVSGLECCGDRPDEDLVVLQRADDHGDEDATVDAAKVMPHGRTARDACQLCWQIPASNGTCGCTY